MRCIYCGKELEESTKFCTQCGQHVTKEGMRTEQNTNKIVKENKQDKISRPARMPERREVKTKKAPVAIIIGSIIAVLVLLFLVVMLVSGRLFPRLFSGTDKKEQNVPITDVESVENFNEKEEDSDDELEDKEDGIADNAVITQGADDTSLLIPVNQTQTVSGFTVIVKSVEFFAAETRVHLIATNKSGTPMSVAPYGAYIVQDGKQYEYDNSVDDGDIMSTSMNNVSKEGFLTFPAVNSSGGLMEIILTSEDSFYDRKDGFFRFYCHPSDPNYVLPSSTEKDDFATSKVNDSVAEYSSTPTPYMEKDSVLPTLQKWYGNDYLDSTLFVDGEIFPHSSERLISDAELETVLVTVLNVDADMDADLYYTGMLEILGYARNEIYARHGHQFKTGGKYAWFYSHYVWYNELPHKEIEHNTLNSTERKNISYIKELEKEIKEELKKL